jgi:hypothetical protein
MQSPATPNLRPRPPAVPASRKPEIICEEFRRFEKNTLVGFATLTLPAVGLRIKDCCFHRKGEAEWVSLPGRQFTKGGETVYAAILDFTSPEAKARFQTAAAAAIRAAMRAESENGAPF